MDDIDKAQQLQDLFQRKALKNQQRQTPEPDQWIEDGTMLCIDCGLEIDTGRLAAKPNAARCTECQGYHELKDRY
jgi:DnaK suppressor protein